ncbi:patatin-like phospholipase family protein, partial [Jannaschia donghaensis]|uniref:patatin-like phospholipase family protein n=1 Tax=Jannaschia donghaensis TaxID=420998 RepID=UPI0006D761BE
MTRPRIALALQGGGAHGAFTWGVLDRLLQEEVEIVALSGASAGAMNAVAVADGLAGDGPEQARDLLRRFWRHVAGVHAFSPARVRPYERFIAATPFGQTPMRAWLQGWEGVLSPYQFNPFDVNPLRRIVEDLFDWDRINSNPAPRLFQAATNLRSGELEIFRQPAIDARTTLASACLPTLYRAVEIAGEAYWDGGYTGNPPLMPLVREAGADDIVFVQVNPFRRDDLPLRGVDVEQRLNEIVFNASLLSELRGIALIREMMARQDARPKRKIRLHRIADEEAMRHLPPGSKMDASPQALLQLRKIGSAAAEHW